MKISEVFYSIQGEGVHQGSPSIFVRLQGCNLDPTCAWCDTEHAQDPLGGEELSVEEVLDRVVQFDPSYRRWVCITGGEPLRQEEDLRDLVLGLRALGSSIEVETNGSFEAPKWWDLVTSWVADMKCPSSGVCGVSRETWFGARSIDQIKFVVADQNDLNWAAGVIRRHLEASPVVLVSPVIPTLPDGGVAIDQPFLQRVVEFCKEWEVRFSLQWHKVIYGDRRGV